MPIVLIDVRNLHRSADYSQRNFAEMYVFNQLLFDGE